MEPQEAESPDADCCRTPTAGLAEGPFASLRGSAPASEVGPLVRGAVAGRGRLVIVIISIISSISSISSISIGIIILFGIISRLREEGPLPLVPAALPDALVLVEDLGRRCLSKATCLIRPHLLSTALLV